MEDTIKFSAKAVSNFVRYIHVYTLSYPRYIECNICGWKGRRFLSSNWHKHVNCPMCHSGVRHRLFIASIQNSGILELGKTVNNKKILHFAPEDSISIILKIRSSKYLTADFFQKGVDMRLDISNMSDIEDESFDTVIAFDVLEHVKNYKVALEEIYRILTPKGFSILTVPQKDNLPETYEDYNVTTPEDRKRHFGQWDHYRIFGNDFPKIVESKGFSVFSVDETTFPDDIVSKHILFPPMLSNHPLATNYRKVFFCQKIPKA